MIKRCFRNRLNSVTRLLLLLALLTTLPAIAGESTLRPFTLHYKVYKSGVHVADTELSLQRSGDFWRWRMSSKASGIYSLFTNKNPYSETTFTLSDDRHQIHNILIADSNDKKRVETARFDWESGKLEVRYRGELKQLELMANVFDFHSIHLLAARMSRLNLKSELVDFYRRGRLEKSRLEYRGKGTLTLNKTEYQTNIFVHTGSQSKSKLTYLYDAKNPLVPIRIEKTKPGKSPTVMLLEKMEWHS